jgi:hypothetical protein
MSTSPEITPSRPDDAIVTLLSEWLAFRADTVELLARLQEIDRDALEGEPADAVDELLQELAGAAPQERGELERCVRETLDAVALG